MVRVSYTAPVIALDIDGTIGDWHNHFVWFCNAIYYPRGPLSVLSPRWADAHGEFDLALDLSKSEYRAAKLAYRSGGLKRCLPIFENDLMKAGPNAVESEVYYLRSQGIQVWICTTRPWLSLSTVDPDTQYWLEHNVGKVDGLIYGEDKYLDLIDCVGKNRILGVVDDLPENIQRARELGLNTAIRRGPHNEYWLAQQRDHAKSGRDFWNTQPFSRIKDMSNIVDGWKETYDEQQQD